jgi:F0F1-type ATP synthase membrane subunit a
MWWRHDHDSIMCRHSPFTDTTSIQGFSLNFPSSTFSLLLLLMLLLSYWKITCSLTNLERLSHYNLHAIRDLVDMDGEKRERKYVGRWKRSIFPLIFTIFIWRISKFKWERERASRIVRQTINSNDVREQQW